MRGNLPNKEPLRRQAWEEEKLYEKDLERTKGRPLFVLHDGPPYANGDLHIGHALNQILKDFITRYKAMSGYHAPYVPGWDTHGLPIETALTRDQKVDRNKVTVAEFREMCANYDLGQVDNQREQFKELGTRGDWDDPYITLTNDYEAAQIRVFGEMAKKGFIYKGLRPVHWSPSSESALAEAEIEYHNMRSPSIYVAFNVVDGIDVLDDDSKVMISRSTRRTIQADIGISILLNRADAVDVVNDQKNVVATVLTDRLETEVDWDNIELVQTFLGRDADR